MTIDMRVLCRQMMILLAFFAHWSIQSLNAHSLAQLNLLFNVEWRNTAITPASISCPTPLSLSLPLWCNDQGDVTRLVVQKTSLNHGGVLPPALLQLTALESLSLIALTDVAPAGAMGLVGLGRLTSLRALTLAHLPDTVRVTLPGAALAKLTDLRELHVAEMAGLEGTLPSELGTLSHLRKLQIFRTGLTGTIPAELGALDKLMHLYLFENALSGLVPTALNKLSALLECRLLRRAVGRTTEHNERNLYTCPLPKLPDACHKQTAFDVQCVGHSEL